MQPLSVELQPVSALGHQEEAGNCLPCSQSASSKGPETITSNLHPLLLSPVWKEVCSRDTDFRPGTRRDEPHPSSGSLSNNSFSLTRLCCVPGPVHFAYLRLLRILRDG